MRVRGLKPVINYDGDVAVRSHPMRVRGLKQPKGQKVVQG